MRLLKFDQTIVDFGLFFTMFGAKHVDTGFQWVITLSTQDCM
jgi:hypothetical protein